MYIPTSSILLHTSSRASFYRLDVSYTLLLSLPIESFVFAEVHYDPSIGCLLLDYMIYAVKLYVIHGRAFPEVLSSSFIFIP